MICGRAYDGTYISLDAANERIVAERYGEVKKEKTEIGRIRLIGPIYQPLPPSLILSLSVGHQMNEEQGYAAKNEQVDPASLVKKKV